MAVYVGTSGWAYAEWQPAFYPPALPRSSFLAHFATALDACEVNATFYRLQTETTVARWAAETPDGFVFAAKAHRGITHGADLGPAGLVERFCESLRPLGPRLGAVLVQLPPSRRRDDDALGRLLDALPPALPVACEFRHRSWEAPAVDAVLAAAGATRCLADLTGEPSDELPAGRIAYVRLRADRYADAQRLAWRDLLAREGASRTVLAFAKHEGVPAGDPHAGVGLARWLRDALHGGG